MEASGYPMSVDAKVTHSNAVRIAKKLGAMERGSGHDNFLHGVLVSFDLTCTNKMWVEFQRYHFAEIVSSQSTMHRVKGVREQNVFNDYGTEGTKKEVYRLLYEYNEEPNKENYLRLLYNIPSGIELTAHIVTNYGQLKTMYLQRYNHRLPEWQEFCKYILTLPMFKELTGINKESDEDE